MTKVEVAECNNIYPRWNLKNIHEMKIEDGCHIDGAGSIVAVIDSAFNIHHAAFAGIIVNGKSFINDKPDYWYSNRERHGTMVTGIVVKYAPKATIFVCCVSEELKYEKEAILKALKHLNDDPQINCKDLVIVMSFGGRPLTTVEEKNKPDDKKVRYKQERRRLIDELVSKGAVCIAAVGNNGLNVDYIASPACLSNVIAVGSMDTFSRPSRSNNPGQEQIDVYAPGEKVSVPSAFDNKKYEEGKGSSCAAPAIGGIVALLKQYGRECGVNVNHILVKKIFSKMTINLDGENILCPKDFFLEYGTKDKFKKLVDELQSSV